MTSVGALRRGCFCCSFRLALHQNAEGADDCAARFTRSFPCTSKTTSFCIPSAFFADRTSSPCSWTRSARMQVDECQPSSTPGACFRLQSRRAFDFVRRLGKVFCRHAIFDLAQEKLAENEYLCSNALTVSFGTYTISKK